MERSLRKSDVQEIHHFIHKKSPERAVLPVDKNGKYSLTKKVVKL
jgi:hypothetical protein